MTSIFFDKIRKYYIEKNIYNEANLETLVNGKLLTEDEKNELIKEKKEAEKDSTDINIEEIQ